MIKEVGAINIGIKRFPGGAKKRLWAIRNAEKWDLAIAADVIKYYREAGVNPTMNY